VSIRSKPKLAALVIAWLSLVFLVDGVSSQVNRQPKPKAAPLKIENNTYDLTDLGHFSPSGAIYFMDGQSDATVRILATGKEMTFHFSDQDTSIAASAPQLFSKELTDKPAFIPVPPPLRPEARYPSGAPARYFRPTTLHLMQVVSMNMKDAASGAKLLIGLPYVEAYPDLFWKSGLFQDKDASSYGVVQSLTTFAGDAKANGYPARSFFSIYHILETSQGVFFNKKPTQMELQPDKNGKLALTLPPIPFLYQLSNGPIPLFDVKNPNGQPVAEIIAAHHESSRAAATPSLDSWPWHQAR